MGVGFTDTYIFKRVQSNQTELTRSKRTDQTCNEPNRNIPIYIEIYQFFIFIYIYIYKYVRVYIYIYMYFSLYMYLYVFIFIYIYIYKYRAIYKGRETNDEYMDMKLARLADRHMERMIFA